MEKASGQVFGSIGIFNALLGEPFTKALWPELDLHRRHLGSRLLHRTEVVEQRSCHRSSKQPYSVLVQPYRRRLADLLPCQRKPASGRVMEKAGFVTPTVSTTTMPISQKSIQHNSPSLAAAPSEMEPAPERFPLFKRLPPCSDKTNDITERTYLERTLRYFGRDTPPPKSFCWRWTRACGTVSAVWPSLPPCAKPTAWRPWHRSPEAQTPETGIVLGSGKLEEARLAARSWARNAPCLTAS